MIAIRGDYFTNTISRDLFDLVVGDPIGSGIGRQVFAYIPDPSCVIKIEAEGRSFQNITEWQVWDAIRETKFKKWFAPCVSISICGTILLQKRAKPVDASELPKKIPAFFTDNQAKNWGFLNKTPVAVDYGFHLLLERGMTGRLMAANWR